VVLQAGIVIGSGSASFEMIRHLTDRLPAMTTPKWVRNKIQPISIDDVLHYLAGAATAEMPTSRTWDIGGPDVMEYGDAMQVYADVAGLRRRLIVVLPFLTPSIASWWVGLVTPIPSGLARPLVESSGVRCGDAQSRCRRRHRAAGGGLTATAMRWSRPCGRTAPHPAWQAAPIEVQFSCAAIGFICQTSVDDLPDLDVAPFCTLAREQNRAAHDAPTVVRFEEVGKAADEIVVRRVLLRCAETLPDVVQRCVCRVPKANIAPGGGPKLRPKSFGHTAGD
jgi:hypothetical protein